MFNLPLDIKTSRFEEPKAVPKMMHKKRHPFRVHLDKLQFKKEMPTKEFRARFGQQEMEAISKKFDKELWESFPSINLIEIRHTNEIEAFKKTLLNIKKTRRSTHIKEYNLAPYGIDRTIQVLGNTYVPIRRSEHQDIQAALMKMNPDQGIKDKRALTFIIVEDALYDNLLLELQRQNEFLHSSLQEGKEKESKEQEVKGHAEVHSKPRARKQLHTLHLEKWKKEATKLLWDTFSDEFQTKDKSKEKREKERLKEEKCIKYGIAQLERLHEMVLKEDVSKKGLESLYRKWDESCPPFPIRSTHAHALWKEYKSNLLLKTSKA